MSIKEKRHVEYVDDETGLIYTWQPVNDEVTITKTDDGYEARYLVQDESPANPDDSGDGSLFLVHYHRDFWVTKDEVITIDDVKAWYQGEKITQQKDYHLFAVSALIHSGVWLSLANYFHEDSGGWDTSHVGAVLVSKKEWKSYKKAQKAAESLLEEWNQYLSGDVYGIVKETYDKDKKPIDRDSVWGFYGHKYAREALKTEI